MTDLHELAALVERETGIALRESHHQALAAALRRTGLGLDANAFLAVAPNPVAGRGALDRLVDEVTVNETFFFRERRQLNAIDWRSLLQGAQTSSLRPVRVWTVGCATGEEPYSLAILACEALGSATPPVSILGTDLSGAALEKAAVALYGKRALRDVPPELRARYFENRGEKLLVRPHVRELVRFSRHNLVKDPIPPLAEARFDVVLCRNVLIYFNQETIERVVAALERALTGQGELLLGSADALAVVRQQPRKPGPARPRATQPRTARPVALSEPQPAAPGRDDARAEFLRGAALLAADSPREAAACLRRALYLDPELGLAAFDLGRAFERLGDGAAAVRSYEQALRTLTPAGADADSPEQLRARAVSSACRTRLRALQTGDRDTS